MNKDTFEGNWHEIKGKIKAKWGRLTDHEIDAVKGNIEGLAGRIQKAYGYAKEEAESQFATFKATLQCNKNTPQSMMNEAKDKIKPNVIKSA